MATLSQLTTPMQLEFFRVQAAMSGAELSFEASDSLRVVFDQFVLGRDEATSLRAAVEASTALARPSAATATIVSREQIAAAAAARAMKSKERNFRKKQIGIMSKMAGAALPDLTATGRASSSSSSPASPAPFLLSNLLSSSFSPRPLNASPLSSSLFGGPPESAICVDLLQGAASGMPANSAATTSDVVVRIGESVGDEFNNSGAVGLSLSVNKDDKRSSTGSTGSSASTTAAGAGRSDHSPTINKSKDNIGRANSVITSATSTASIAARSDAFKIGDNGIGTAASNGAPSGSAAVSEFLNLADQSPVATTADAISDDKFMAAANMVRREPVVTTNSTAAAEPMTMQSGRRQKAPTQLQQLAEFVQTLTQKFDAQAHHNSVQGHQIGLLNQKIELQDIKIVELNETIGTQLGRSDALETENSQFKHKIETLEHKVETQGVTIRDLREENRELKAGNRVLTAGHVKLEADVGRLNKLTESQCGELNALKQKTDQEIADLHDDVGHLGTTAALATLHCMKIAFAATERVGLTQHRQQGQEHWHALPHESYDQHATTHVVSSGAGSASVSSELSTAAPLSSPTLSLPESSTSSAAVAASVDVFDDESHVDRFRVALTAKYNKLALANRRDGVFAQSDFIDDLCNRLQSTSSARHAELHPKPPIFSRAKLQSIIRTLQRVEPSLSKTFRMMFSSFDQLCGHFLVA